MRNLAVFDDHYDKPLTTDALAPVVVTSQRLAGFGRGSRGRFEPADEV